MKIYLTIILSFLLAPVLVFAAYTDVTMSGSSIIQVGGNNLIVSGTANFDSLTVGSNSFSVIMSKNATLTVTSSDRLSFGVAPSEYFKQSFTCGSSNSTLTIGNSSLDDAKTVTVELSSVCSSGTSGTGGGGMIISGGGGGGGGGSYAPVAPQVVQAPATVPAVAPSQIAVSVSPIFTKTFGIGAASSDIKRLQQILNSDPDTQISSSGAGSPGNETTYFGPATKAALQKFQSKYGIVSSGSPETTGYGALGPKTRAKLAEVFAKATPTAPSVAQPSPVAVSVSPVFTIGFTKGTTNPDIKRLQQLLNSDADTKIAESGVGSPGNETEYFGSLTEKAVQKFQVKYGVAQEGDPGYGYVGPKTRAKLQEVFKE
ncbi:MAG: peptidoglycan-binding protein [Candidatus Tagabacteria bacterium]